MAAVFGPTPLIATSQALASSTGSSLRKSSDSSPRSAEMVASARWIAGPLWFASPATWIASTIASAPASRTASQVGKHSRSRPYARSRFTSLVFCERMVETSTPTGSRSRRQGGAP